MNPTWTEQELLLLYDLYLRLGRRTVSSRNPEVQELSAYLRSLPWHTGVWRDTQFRNARGTAIKLRQLKAYEEDGPPPSIHLGLRDLAHRYRNHPEDVHRLADAIRAAAEAQIALPSADASAEDDPDPSDLTFNEGQRKMQLHERAERSRRAVNLKLATVRAATGTLSCEACGFDFEAVYGQLGRGFAECHHLWPLGATGERATTLDDLAVVCANCHRMLHRQTAPGVLLTIQELKWQIQRPVP